MNKILTKVCSIFNLSIVEFPSIMAQVLFAAYIFMYRHHQIIHIYLTFILECSCLLSIVNTLYIHCKYIILYIVIIYIIV